MKSYDESSVLAVEVERRDARDRCSSPFVCRRSSPPFHEQKSGADQVEAALLAVVQVREQRRDQRVAAVRARAGEVQRSEPVVGLAGSAAVHERPDDRRAVLLDRARFQNSGKRMSSRVLGAPAVVVDAAEERGAVRLRRIRQARLSALEPEREQRAEMVACRSARRTTDRRSGVSSTGRGPPADRRERRRCRSLDVTSGETSSGFAGSVGSRTGRHDLVRRAGCGVRLGLVGILLLRLLAAALPRRRDRSCRGPCPRPCPDPCRHPSRGRTARRPRRPEEPQRDDEHHGPDCAAAALQRGLLVLRNGRGDELRDAIDRGVASAPRARCGPRDPSP